MKATVKNSSTGSEGGERGEWRLQSGVGGGRVDEGAPRASGWHTKLLTRQRLPAMLWLLPKTIAAVGCSRWHIFCRVQVQCIAICPRPVVLFMLGQPLLYSMHLALAETLICFAHAFSRCLTSYHASCKPGGGGGGLLPYSGHLRFIFQ